MKNKNVDTRVVALVGYGFGTAVLAYVGIAILFLLVVGPEVLK
jgi:hypothetical protein